MIFPLRLQVSFIPFLCKERFDRHNLSATFSSDSDVKLDFAIVTSLTKSCIVECPVNNGHE